MVLLVRLSAGVREGREEDRADVGEDRLFQMKSTEVADARKSRRQSAIPPGIFSFTETGAGPCQRENDLV